MGVKGAGARPLAECVLDTKCRTLLTLPPVPKCVGYAYRILVRGSFAASRSVGRLHARMGRSASEDSRSGTTLESGAQPKARLPQCGQDPHEDRGELGTRCGEMEARRI